MKRTGTETVAKRFHVCSNLLTPFCFCFIKWFIAVVSGF